jgi:hypothetical protein
VGIFDDAFVAQSAELASRYEAAILAATPRDADPDVIAHAAFTAAYRVGATEPCYGGVGYFAAMALVCGAGSAEAADAAATTFSSGEGPLTGDPTP